MVLLRTVLNNLIRNAFHHTLQGQVSLEVTAHGVDVRDTGPGLSAEEKSQVFNPDYRGTATHSSSLGLGLSLVQRICEREHWSLSLQDNQPSGCRFVLKFS